VPAGGVHADLEPWWIAARAAVAAGAGTVWFSGGGALDGPGNAGSCDPCTIAASAVDAVPRTRLGVISPLPHGRNPAVLARELTTLDFVSDGRAAALFRFAPEVSGTEPHAWELMAEAVAVCRAVLSDPHPLFEGRFFHVAGALNRPPAPQGGRLLLAVQVPTAAPAFAAWGATVPALVGHLFAGSSAVVCPDDPQEVKAWRATIDDVTTVLQAQTAEPGRPRAAPAILCRTTLVPIRTTLPPTTASGPLLAARAAGADGVVVRIPGARRGDVAFSGFASDPGALERALEGAFAPWTS